MAVLDLLGRRWTLRVLWELRGGPLGFRALQERCDGMSSSVLSDRLAELAGAGVTRRDERGSWALSAEGGRLLDALRPLAEWADGWAARVEPGSGAATPGRSAAAPARPRPGGRAR